MAFMKKRSAVKAAEEQAKTVSIDFSFCKDSEEFVVKTVQAIQECPGMKTLRLEGQGIDIIAAKAIGKALEGQSCLENVIWRKIFKIIDDSEMIEVLIFMTKGIIRANAKLVTFKLTDNALGPVVLVGLREFFISPCCLTLQELSLSNNCLGCRGAKLISECLRKCNENGLNVGTPMKLKVFEYSDNQLGDEGVAYISKFLEKLESLESIDLAKNRIGYRGVIELSLAIYSNRSLAKLILNDNKLSEYGVIHLARCVQSLPKLQTLSLRRCYLTAGDVRILAASLENNCPAVRRIDLSYNMIGAGIDVLLDVMEKNSHFEDLDITSNPLSRAVEESLESRILSLKKRKGAMKNDVVGMMDSESQQQEGIHQ